MNTVTPNDNEKAAAVLERVRSEYERSDAVGSRVKVEALETAIQALRTQAPSAEPVATVTVPAHMKLGETMFTPPDEEVRFCYSRGQPDNVNAWRIGEACQQAAKASAGDYIDRGLVLLKMLEADGYGIFRFVKDSSPPAALRHSAGGVVADGWVLVPREPTREMVEAVLREGGGCTLGDSENDWTAGDKTQAQAIIAAMLAAAPSGDAGGGSRRGRIVAWTRTDFIYDDRGTPIGEDEPRVRWQAENPDPSPDGEAWWPLYDGPTPPPCKTCNGYGEIGGPTGQTPENFGFDSVPRPECSAPTEPAPPAKCYWPDCGFDTNGTGGGKCPRCEGGNSAAATTHDAPPAEPARRGEEDDERKAAEQVYALTAFDYPSNPVGSRDWTIFWRGWCYRVYHFTTTAALTTPPHEAREDSPDVIGAPSPVPAADKRSRWHLCYIDTMVRAGVGGEMAVATCEAGYDDHDYDSDPEDAATSEMSYWDDDDPTPRGGNEG